LRKIGIQKKENTTIEGTDTILVAATVTTEEHDDDHDDDGMVKKGYDCLMYNRQPMQQSIQESEANKLYNNDTSLDNDDDME
jgi:hypothetical protein